MKCFYHSADLDGHCSAAIVKAVCPECELIGINYGDAFPWDLFVEAEERKSGSIILPAKEPETVYMVDFCLQPFTDVVGIVDDGQHGKRKRDDHDQQQRGRHHHHRKAPLAPQSLLRRQHQRPRRDHDQRRPDQRRQKRLQDPQAREDHDRDKQRCQDGARKFPQVR